MLALADGVGSCVDDARASKTTCDLFIKKCKTAIDNNDFLDRAKLDSYCREIDPILAIDGDMAVFVL